MTREKSEYIRNWLFRANEDMAVIENLVKAGAGYYSSSICFHAQQASEKYLKAFLAYHDVDFPRTHDLDYLLLECQKLDKDAFQIDFKSLTDFGLSVRYPDDFYIPDEKEALEYRDTALLVKEIVDRLIR
jgi:HEPN domain-containing protein